MSEIINPTTGTVTTTGNNNNDCWDVKATVDRLGYSILDHQARNHTSELTETLKTGTQGIQATEGRLSDVRRELQAGIADVRQEVESTSGATEVAVERGVSANLTATNAVGAATALASKESQIQVSDKVAHLALEAAKNTNAIEARFLHAVHGLELQNERNTAALTLQANQLAATAAAKAAECCCETKIAFKDTIIAIHADGDRTRDLINLNENNRLRDRITFLELRHPMTAA